ncbi:MAG: hypothetical protein JO265_10750, partial [Acidimicrobiia bacterium]|nr:hypothetical protein [Acidimicrobiia bacterium]
MSDAPLHAGQERAAARHAGEDAAVHAGEERRSNLRRLVTAAIVAGFGLASLGLWGVPVVANPLQPKSLDVT